jgi:DNA/RNA-binding domain of Phe-tRNA-synthetase-like protein
MSKLYSITIDEDIFNEFKSVFVSGIVVRGLDVKEEIPSILESYLSPLNEQLKSNSLNVNVNEHPEVVKWRTVYKKMGLKPSRYHCSFESLYRRFLKGTNVFGVNNVVDSYNAVSLTHGKCMGGYDLDKINGYIKLRFSIEGESVLLIGAKTPLSLNEKAVVYADEAKVLCAYWNYRDSEVSKITEDTKNAVFFVDEIDLTQSSGHDVLNDLSNILQEACGAEIVYQFQLSKDIPSFYFYF